MSGCVSSQGSHAHHIDWSQYNLADGHSSFTDYMLEWLENKLVEGQFIVRNIISLFLALTLVIANSGKWYFRTWRMKEQNLQGIFKMTIGIKHTLIVLAVGHCQGGSQKSEAY